VLMGADTLCDGSAKPRYRFFVTDEPSHFNRLASRFLGQVMGVAERVNSFNSH
ncbi:MAG: hypothetical protein HYU33_02105, partial [Candidatus Omnitrophica bacterium]|nr:hypothetical protein [Candidatus Omnitrophota bacterium]